MDFNEQKKEVVSYLKHGDKKAVAEKLGISRSYINKVLNAETDQHFTRTEMLAWKGIIKCAIKNKNENGQNERAICSELSV